MTNIEDVLKYETPKATVLNIDGTGRPPTSRELINKYYKALKNHEYDGASEYKSMLQERMFGDTNNDKV